MNGIPLQIVEQHLYLGVYLHHRMSWQPQVDYVCNKANRILGFLWRNLRGSSRTLREASYLHFVLPILDYCCPIWDPYHQTSIHKLEMIQHRAARFVLNKPWRRTNHDSISDILEALKWPPLKERRQHARLVLLFKLTSNLLSISSTYLPSSSPLTITRAQHKLKYLHTQSTSNTYRYSFFSRTIPEWNNLQIPDLHNLTLNQFKQQLVIIRI